MEIYKVVLPEDSKLDHIQLWGLGMFLRGKTRDLELTEE